MAAVNFNGRTVTDSVVKEILTNLANYFERDLNVTSGDRSYVPEGGSETSLHLKGRAADFKLTGLDYATVYLNLRNISANVVFVPGHKYELIWHGPFTTTTGEHLHLGRITKGSPGYVKFIQEGVTSEGAGSYPVDKQVVLTGPAPIPSTYLKWL